MNLTPEEKEVGRSNYYEATAVNRRSFLKGVIGAGAVSGAGLGAMYFGYDKVTERGRFKIAAARRVQPNTNGQPQDRYDLRFNGKSRLTPKLNLDWKFLVWQQQAIALQAISEEENEELTLKTLFFSGILQLNWSLTRKWALSGRYTYRQRDRDAGINSEEQFSATGNQLYFGMTYVWKDIQR